MASTPQATALTERHRRQQAALAAAAVAELGRLWPAWSVDDPRSFDAMLDGAVLLTTARRRQSAGLAASYYRTFRTLEAPGGMEALRVAQDLEVDRLRSYLRGAGLGGTVRALRAGRNMGYARQVGFTGLAGAVTMLVSNGSRDTLLGSMEADRQALGWQRVTASDPCAFCLMVSSRGPVFKDEADARFEPHKACGCHPEVVYREHLTGQARAHRDLWQQAQEWAQETGNMPSGTKNDSLNALRRFMNR